MIRTTHESTASRRRGSSLAVKLGALVAATSLMLVGGAVVASASYAKDNPNQGGNSGNAPGQNDNNGGAVHGDNGGGNGGGPGSGTGNSGNNGQNSDNGAGGTGVLHIAICHATRSYQNPYVYIVTDVSSVDELLRITSGVGNGHGDHVGAIFDPAVNRSGNNWGDIISSVTGANGKLYYPGYNLGGGGQAILDRGCTFSTPGEVSVPLCVVKAPDTVYGTLDFKVTDTGDNAANKTAAIAAAEGQGYTVSADGSACGSNPCVENCVTGATANDGAAFCEVTNDSYNGVQSVQVYNVPGADAAAAQAAADAQVLAALQGKANGDNIVPPHKAFAGYNWNAKTQARFNGGCSPDQKVLSVNAASAGTSQPASGKPAPAKVPAKGQALPAAVPAGDGSSAPVVPMWALALLVVGAIGAAASGVSLATSRKG